MIVCLSVGGIHSNSTPPRLLPVYDVAIRDCDGDGVDIVFLVGLECCVTDVRCAGDDVSSIAAL